MDLEKMKVEIEALNSTLKTEKINPDKKRLAEMQAAVDAEEKRLNSKAYKDALKKIDELANDAEARKAAIHKTIDELMDEFQAWENICKQHKQLWKKHQVEARDLYASEYGKLVRLQAELARWKKSMKTLEAMKKPLINAKPVHPKKALPINEHEKMMRERYPVKNETRR